MPLHARQDGRSINQRKVVVNNVHNRSELARLMDGGGREVGGKRSSEQQQ